jgi:hypothetical protein
VPSGDDPLERLRAAIDQLATFDVDGLVAEARAEARAHVRGILVELMEQSMLERVGQELTATHHTPQPEQRSEPEPQLPPDPPPADPEPETGPAAYVYGVVDAGDAPEMSLPGVDPSRPVRLLREGALAAAVSEVALEEFGEAPLREHLRDMRWVERVARAHETVLDQIQARATVVPMRMCTVYRSESGVRDMLRREATSLEQALDHLDGKSEWGVKAFADPSEVAAAAADDAREAGGDEDETRGAAYMRQRQGERDHRERAQQQLDEIAVQIHERLCMLAGDGRVMPPQRPEVSGHAGDMVLNGVYLVADDDQERFHAEVQVLEAEFAPLGVTLQQTGPWPAYNFVPGAIGAAW